MGKKNLDLSLPGNTGIIQIILMAGNGTSAVIRVVMAVGVKQRS